MKKIPVKQENKDIASNRPTLQIYYTNADSLANKLPEFSSSVKEESPDIIFVAEVKPKNFKDDICEVLFQIDGYNMLSLNLDSRVGRGVIMYIRKGIRYNHYIPKTEYTESLWVILDLGINGKAVIGGVYRSDSGTEINNLRLLDLVKEVAEMRPSYLLIMGDFNYGHIDWNCQMPTGAAVVDGPEERFIECLRDCFLTQHIYEHTRTRLNNTPSILDLVFTNEEHLVDNIVYHGPLGKSDHCVLTFDMTIGSLDKITQVQRLNYAKANYTRMRENLSQINWNDEMAQFSGAEEMWSYFKDKLMIEIKKFTPVHKPFVNNTGREFEIKLDEKTLRKRKEKSRAWRKYRRTKVEADYKIYARARNQLRNLTRSAHKRVERGVVKEARSNPKRFWKYVNSKSKMRGVIPELKVANGNNGSEMTKSDVEKAEVLSAFFSSVFTPESNEELPAFIVPNNEKYMSWSSIKMEEVKFKLDNLNVNKSTGPDSIPPRVLYELRNELANPITILFNSSVEGGYVPKEWKLANVSPIFKKGSKSEANNYRPVSLTSVLCKILESLVKVKIMDFMMESSLFSKKQFGFISGRSTSLQLLKVMEDWTKILDEGGRVDCVYFDFMKAFDKVSHRHLLYKLEAYHLNKMVLKWISSFLTSRMQRVGVAGSFSGWTPVTSGIPQGSVLGPVFFIMYINDLEWNIESNTYLFADDTKIYRHILTEMDHNILQKDIATLECWSNSWQLKIHPAKCKFMNVGKNRDDEYVYRVKDGANMSAMERVESEKDLGVTFDDRLSFGVHIVEKVNKANRMLGLIRRSFYFLDEQSLVILYKAMVRPHLEFSQSVWSPHLLKFVDMIERVQRRATRLLPGLRALPYEERLLKLKLPSMAYRRLRGDLIECYKITKNLYDPRVSEGILTKAEECRTRGHTEKLFLNRGSANVRKHVFSIRVCIPWNSLPQSVIDAANINTFKARLDRCLHSQPLLHDYRSKFDVNLVK